MSVKLIVFPQSYEGQYSNVSTPSFTEYVPDYTFNTAISGSTSSVSNSNTFYNNIITTNNWKHFFSDGTQYTAVATPNVSAGVLRIPSAVGSESGSYISVSGLVVGADYDIEINVNTGSTGTLLIGNYFTSQWTVNSIVYYSIPNGIFQNINPASGTTYTHTFTADQTTQSLILTWQGQSTTALQLNSVSIKENILSAPLLYSDIHDGQVICDLYNEDSIPLTLSIDNFKNVAEKAQSYSKSFKLPATKRNNKIFSSLFDVTRSVREDAYAFNPYMKTKAILKEDGYTIFEGYLKLSSIDESDGEISYNVNLYSDTVSLKDTLSKRKFSDLDFSELEHTYDKSTIKKSWEGELPITTVPAGYTGHMTDDNGVRCTGGETKTDVLKYPFVQWNGETHVDSTGTNAGNVHITQLNHVFRPWIRCKYLLDRILDEAGFTYSSDFLISSDFTRLFMDFNWGEGNHPVSQTNADFCYYIAIETATTSYQPIEITQWSTGSSTSLIPQWNNISHRFVCDIDGQSYDCSSYSFEFTNTTGTDRQLDVRWVVKDGSTVIQQINPVVNQTVTAGGTWSYGGDFMGSVTLDDTQTLECEYKASVNSAIDVGPWGFMWIQASKNNITDQDILQTKRGEIVQWDFVKDILTMFNLVVLKDKDDANNFIIEPYRAVFIDDSESQYITFKDTVTDWTDKVENKDLKLTTIKLKKEVTFNYKKDEKDYAAGKFAQASGQPFGSQIFDASGFTLLEGTEKVELKLFAATVCKPFSNDFTSLLTVPIIISLKDDGLTEAFDNKPRILYDNTHTTPTSMGGATMHIPVAYGLTSENQPNFCQFSHVTDIPTTANSKDFNFWSHQLFSTLGFPPVHNLYNTYWAPYYYELYDPDTKTVSLKLFLTPSDLASFEFYDKVRIKNREYRVNKIDYKPSDLSSVEFILIS